jgi:glycosyltransferase involved in cell wall biosynthesis
MSQLPLVSVVIAVRDGERYLREAIDSVLAQRYEPYEIVVVDGDSSDRSREIAGAVPGVRVVRQAGRGIANAYNEGIAAARGELLAFLSHDDLWAPDKLERQAGLMAARPELEYTIAMARYFLEDGCAPPPGFRRDLLDRDVVGCMMETLVARRAVFDRVGRFDESFEIGEDADWYARAKDHGAVSAVVPDVLLRKRVHGVNLSLNSPTDYACLLRALRGSIGRKRAAAAGPAE